MPFNPPGIIGGGRLVSPAVNQDPFKGINDAITRARDRKLKEKALMLEAWQIYNEAEANYSGEPELDAEGNIIGTIDTPFPSFQEWYKTHTKNPGQSQASKGGFFGMLGDIAMAPIDQIGKIGKDLFTQGEVSATKEIQANNKLRTDANNNGGEVDYSDADSSDPLKKANQLKSENDGKFDKYLTDKSSNLTTANDQNLQDEGKPWYSFLTSPSAYQQKKEKEKEEELINAAYSINPYSGNVTYNQQRGGDVPGNRTGDKNKAYLEDGEYVLNRNAVEGVGKGFLDYINNERYPRFQAGGFNAPTIMGGGQIAQPRPPEEEEKEGGGGGMKEMGKAVASLLKKKFMQSGGYVPGYQSGGYMSQRRANYLQDKRNKEAMSDFRKAKDRYNVGVNRQEMEMDEYQENLSSGLSGAGLWAADLLTPDWVTGPLLSWYHGTDVEDIEDIPRALADKSKAEYAKTYMREEMEAPFGEGVQPTAEMLAEKQAYAGTPTAPLTTRLSNDALKRESQKAMGNFNIQEWLESQYGENWWSSMGTNPMGN